MRIQSLVVLGVVLAITARVQARGVALVVIAPANRFLEFGRTPFDQPSPPQRIVIRNAGELTAADFSEINRGPYQIVATDGDYGPGHEKSYDVVCNPSILTQGFNGNFHYDACASGCGDDESEGNIMLSCTGGLLDADDSNASSPPVFAYEISHARLVFTNPGPVPLTITGFAVDPAVFSVALASGMLPRTLAPGDSIDVIVSFDSSGLSFINDPVLGRVDVLAGTSIIGRVAVQGYVLSQIDLPLANRFIVPQGAAYTVPISVRNSFPSARTIAAATSDDLSYSVTGLAGVTLAPGGRAHGLVTFTANLLGTRNGHIAVAFDTGQGDTAPVFAEVVAPRFSITTDDATPGDGRLDFGTRLAGSGPIERTVTFTNLDSAALSVAFCIDAFPPFEIVLSGSCPEAIPVGGSITATVRFTPVDGGDTTGATGIVIAGLGEAFAVLSARVYQLTFSATVVEFPDTPRADIADQVVTISNAGTNPVRVPVTVSGAGFTSREATVTIPGGGTADVDVAFQPPAAGMFTGTLEIGGAGDVEHTVISLSGTGISPLVSVAPSLDLGAVVVGATGDAMLEIHNQDQVHSFTIADLVVTGAGFSAVLSEDPVLTPGATRQITVAFTPASAGAAAGTLSIVLAGDQTPHAIVSLSASGVAAPEMPPVGRPHTGGCDAGDTTGGWLGLVALALWLATSVQEAQRGRRLLRCPDLQPIRAAPWVSPAHERPQGHAGDAVR